MVTEGFQFNVRTCVWSHGSPEFFYLASLVTVQGDEQEAKYLVDKQMKLQIVILWRFNTLWNGVHQCLLKPLQQLVLRPHTHDGNGSGRLSMNILPTREIRGHTA